MMNRETIILEASRLWGRERSRFLEMACAEDLQLRNQIEAELDPDFQTPGCLVDPDADTTVKIPTEIFSALTGDQPGEIIDRYRLLQKIGEGGFGVVWMAEQLEPVTRRVALKVIKPGLGSVEIIGRFETERQALAMMDHPNIAKVLDAGTTVRGYPYFVMDLIRGLPITRFCDKQRYGIAERLRIFCDVCQAVQHAHQKGIIHRDLKPSNILVGLDGDCPVAKIIDFGIAKAIDQRLTLKPVFTRFEQFIGTPAYISPEQSTLSILDVDTRSDIYSLGVLLYELLTGSTPIESSILMSGNLDELRRIIKEEEPPKPSTKVSRTDPEALLTIAAARQIGPRELTTKVKGDLDWIVLKALEKQRERRYSTADALRSDLQLFLQNKPVSAAAPSLIYKTRKFAKRHRTGLAFAAIVVGVTLTSGAVAFSNFLEAKKERRLKESSILDAMEFGRQTVPRLLGDYTRMLEREGKEGELEMVKNITTDYIAKFGIDPGHPEQARLIAWTIVHEGDVLRSGSKFAAAAGTYQRAISNMSEVVRRHPDHQLLNLDYAVIWNNLGNALKDQGMVANALEAFENGKDLLEKLETGHHGDTDILRELGVAHSSIGDLHSRADRLEAAKESHLEALRIREALLQKKPGDRRWLADRANSLLRLGGILQGGGEWNAAEERLGEAVTIYQNLAEAPPDLPMRAQLAHAHDKLGQTLLELEKSEAAIASFEKSASIRQTMTELAPSVTAYKADLAVGHVLFSKAFSRLEKPGEALKKLLEAETVLLAMTREYPENISWRRSLGITLKTKADAMLEIGEKSEAVMAYQAAVRILEELDKADRLTSGDSEDLKEVKETLNRLLEKSPNID